jgi:transposase
MLGIAFSPRIYLFSHPTDMRKNFDGLTGLVTIHLKKDPIRDGAFVFVNKRRDKMKILLFDRHGFWIMYKRLESGRFQIPPEGSLSTPEGLALTYEQLVMIIEGIDLKSVRRRKRYEIANDTA